MNITYFYSVEIFNRKINKHSSGILSYSDKIPTEDVFHKIITKHEDMFGKDVEIKILAFNRV